MFKWYLLEAPPSRYVAILGNYFATGQLNKEDELAKFVLTNSG